MKKHVMQEKRQNRLTHSDGSTDLYFPTGTKSLRASQLFPSILENVCAIEVSCGEILY